jgi:hypothetical protein
MMTDDEVNQKLYSIQEEEEEEEFKMDREHPYHVRLYRRNSTFARSTYHDMIVNVMYPFVCEHLYQCKKSEDTTTATSTSTNSTQSSLSIYQATLFYPYVVTMDNNSYDANPFENCNSDKENSSVQTLLRNQRRQHIPRFICSPFRYYKNTQDYIKVAQLIVNNQDYQVMDMDLNKHITISQLREYVSVCLLVKVILTVKPYYEKYPFLSEELIKAAEVACRGLYFHVPCNTQLRRLLFGDTTHSQAGTKLSIPLSCELTTSSLEEDNECFFIYQLRRKYNLSDPKTTHISCQVYENCGTQCRSNVSHQDEFNVNISQESNNSGVMYLNRNSYLFVSLFEYILANYVHEWYHGNHNTTTSGRFGTDQNAEKNLNLNHIEPIIESIFQNQFYFITCEPDVTQPIRKSTHTALDLLTLKRSSYKTITPNNNNNSNLTSSSAPPLPSFSSSTTYKNNNKHVSVTDNNISNPSSSSPSLALSSSSSYYIPLVIGYMINPDGSSSSTSSDLSCNSSNYISLRSFSNVGTIRKYLFNPYQELPSLKEHFILEKE